MRAPRSTTRYAIHVGVQAAAPAEFALDVEYGVRQASWQPVYDLRLEGDRLTLSYMATVAQQSGEDWPETTLALSTARPRAGAKLPELSPWYVDRYYVPPPQPLAYAPKPRAAGGMATVMRRWSPRLPPSPMRFCRSRKNQRLRPRRPPKCSRPVLTGEAAGR
jgi:uncharacterized protein (TIGR02231 family)